MRRFDLIRETDYTGVSGTGRIAEGCAFGNGTVALRWVTGPGSYALWGSVDDMLQVHGHDGATHIRWQDPPEAGPWSSR